MGLVRYYVAITKTGKIVWHKGELITRPVPRTGMSKKFQNECELAAKAMGEPFAFGIRHGQAVS
jgi:hypothetical protein